MVSQCMHSPIEECFEIVYQVLGYLKESLGKRLLFKKKRHMQIRVYTDANWARNNKDGRSTPGYLLEVTR